VIDDINHLKCEYDVDINNVVTYVVKSVLALPEISGIDWTLYSMEHHLYVSCNFRNFPQSKQKRFAASRT
jgi:hypothetical protein